MMKLRKSLGNNRRGRILKSSKKDNKHCEAEAQNEGTEQRISRSDSLQEP